MWETLVVILAYTFILIVLRYDHARTIQTLENTIKELRNDVTRRDDQIIQVIAGIHLSGKTNASPVPKYMESAPYMGDPEMAELEERYGPEKH